MRLSLQEIEAFRAVVKELSFTRAAARLATTQPRLSVLIRDFEERIGFPLFTRTSRSVQLTDAGRAFFALTDDVEASVQACADYIRQNQRTSRNRLSIGAPIHTRRVRNRARIISEIALEHPHLKVEVVNGFTEDLIEALRSQRVDAAFLFSHVETPGLETTPVAISRGFVVVPEGDAWATRNAIDVAELQGRRVATLPKVMGSLYKRICAPLVQAGCDLLDAPEAAPDELLAFAGQLRIPAVCNLWDGQALEAPGRVAIPLIGIDLSVSLVLARRMGDNRRLLERLWTLAQDEPEAAPAH